MEIKINLLTISAQKIELMMIINEKFLTLFDDLTWLIKMASNTDRKAELLNLNEIISVVLDIQ